MATTTAAKNKNYPTVKDTVFSIDVQNYFNRIPHENYNLADIYLSTAKLRTQLLNLRIVITRKHVSSAFSVA